MAEPLNNDPYRSCEDGRCNHDLTRAVSVAELLGGDGPYPPTFLVATLAPSHTADVAGPSLFDDSEQPAETLREAI